MGLPDRDAEIRRVLDEPINELDADCRTYAALVTRDMGKTKAQLSLKYSRVEDDEEKGTLRVYDPVSPEEIVNYLYRKQITVSEIWTDKVSLEEYYIDLMAKKGGQIAWTQKTRK